MTLGNCIHTNPRPATGSRRSVLSVAVCALFLAIAEPAWAFQSHPSPEGLYAHQMAHVIFLSAMGILAYWLQVNGFTKERGWRLIQVACLFFLAWNAIAALGHWIEEGLSPVIMVGPPDWRQKIRLASDPWSIAYYVLKLDHLVSIPAMVCLVLGLKALCRKVLNEADRRDS
jgi:hypothetical protein